MKFNHKCEYCGCSRNATRRGRNGHWFCHDHHKLLMQRHRDLGHNSFLREITIGSVGKYRIFIDRFFKFI